MYKLNTALKVLLLSNSIVLLAGAMLGPIYALFVEDIGGDLLDASYAGAAFMVAAGFMALFSGRLSDKVKDPKQIVVVGYLVMAVGYGAFVFVNSIWALLVVQVIIGLGEALYAPPVTAIFSKHVDNKKAGKQWSTWDAAFYFTSAIGAVLGGLIVSFFSFDILFLAMCTLCIWGALYFQLTSLNEPE